MSLDIDTLLGSTRSAPPVPRLGRKSRWRRLLGNRAVIMLIINIAFIVIMTQLSPYFLYAGNGFANFKVMFVSMAMDTIVLAAMVMLLIGGMFDLSVDGVVNMTGVVTGALLASGVAIWVAVLAGVASALVVGIVNGVAVTRLKMNPLMTTLGTWWVSQGLAFGITQGISSHSFPQGFIDIGYAAPLGVTMPIWYAGVLVAIAIWVLAKTKSATTSTPPAGIAKAPACMASRSTASPSSPSRSSRWRAPFPGLSMPPASMPRCRRR